MCLKQFCSKIVEITNSGQLVNTIFSKPPKSPNRGHRVSTNVFLPEDRMRVIPPQQWHGVVDQFQRFDEPHLYEPQTGQNIYQGHQQQQHQHRRQVLHSQFQQRPSRNSLPPSSSHVHQEHAQWNQKQQYCSYRRNNDNNPSHSLHPFPQQHQQQEQLYSHHQNIPLPHQSHTANIPPYEISESSYHINEDIIMNGTVQHSNGGVPMGWTNDRMKLKPGHAPIKLELVKTSLCRHYLSGYCSRGSVCNFAHGQAELRSSPCYMSNRHSSVGSLTAEQMAPWNKTGNFRNDSNRFQAEPEIYTNIKDMIGNSLDSKQPKRKSLFYTKSPIHQGVGTPSPIARRQSDISNNFSQGSGKRLDSSITPTRVRAKTPPPPPPPPIAGSKEAVGFRGNLRIVPDSTVESSLVLNPNKQDNLTTKSPVSQISPSAMVENNQNIQNIRNYRSISKKLEVVSEQEFSFVDVADMFSELNRTKNAHEVTRTKNINQNVPNLLSLVPCTTTSPISKGCGTPQNGNSLGTKFGTDSISPLPINLDERVSPIKNDINQDMEDFDKNSESNEISPLVSLPSTLLEALEE